MEDLQFSVVEHGQYLPREELERAARFRIESSRNRYLIGRYIVRSLASAYTGIKPEKIEIRYKKEGKPFIDETYGMHFSISHSASLVACAVTQMRQLGVDVEKIRPLQNENAIAKRSFSDLELNSLSNLNKKAYLRGFFQGWTQKEAFVKAIGDGLKRSLKTVEVSCGALGSRFTRIEGDDANAWTLRTFEPLPGYIGAVAIRSHIENLIMRRVFAPNKDQSNLPFCHSSQTRCVS